MWRRFQPPLAVVAVALLGLIVMLAVLQYRWLGQISEAERAQRRATLAAGAVEFAQDFDREINRAYLLFQGESRNLPGLTQSEADSDPQLVERFAARYDHWQASSRFPRIVKEMYSFTYTEAGKGELRRFDPVQRRLEIVEWPAAMAGWRDHLGAVATKETPQGGNTFFIRRIPSAIWEDVPALVVPSPIIFMSPPPNGPGAAGKISVTAAWHSMSIPSSIRYALLTIDRDYVARELLPTLARRHFSQQRDGDGVPSVLDFKVAVLSRAGPVFQSSSSFAPAFDESADATAEFFHVRTQDFTALVSEVRRFTGLVTPDAGASARAGTSETRPMSIFIQQSATAGGRSGTAATRLTTSVTPPLWKLVVAHPSGSLETAVNAARRRNLMVSFSILGILGASMGLLVLSTRRAQRLATQQMEFVATVSHELRTPLAVIRSAAENLADGVVHDEDRIRRYGELMRTEGRRLTDMVEQILEFAGIQSGQRGFALRPVAIDPLVRGILSSSSSIIEGAGVTVDVDLPANLPPVLGDEPALRRVFQNLIDNAVKYGASGGWLRVSARAAGSEVLVTVADRGMGIAPADQARIFEPFYRAADVVAAQMQGAGLGLSLVQRIVTAHAGRVSVKSTPPNGSEFTVHLPAAGEDRAAAAAVKAGADDGRGIEAPRYS